MLGAGDDLGAAIAGAVRSGADALGMAGGDGSLAPVAAAAAGHDLPFVCLPAGTRNHFALDVRIDRHDRVGAIDAVTAASHPGSRGRGQRGPFLNNARWASTARQCGVGLPRREAEEDPRDRRCGPVGG